MRTKTILLSAAVFAAGLAASTAQSVYSINAVGYVNWTLRAGYNLLANPLNGTNNNIRTVIPTAPQDSVLFTWNGALQTFNQADTYDSTIGWFDQGFNPSSTILAPGQGFFLQNPGGNFTLTFVGEVPQGNLTNTIVANYGFYSSIVPQSAGLSTMGFPGVVDMNYYSWNPVGQTYNQAYTYVGVQAGFPTGWADQGFNSVDPTPAVAEGFLIQNPGGVQQWGRTFSVNN
jgi:hypothetical protein